MIHRGIRPSLVALLASFALTSARAAEPAAATAASPGDGKMAKVCGTCHKSAPPGTVRGAFDGAAWKSKSIQLKVDAETLVLPFDAAALRLVNAGETGDLEKALGAIRKGAESYVETTGTGTARRITLLVLKPKLAVPEEKQIKTAALEKLVAQGPEKGKYFLFDARPAGKFAEGFIPTAENLPFPAFEKEKGKLPADKGALIIYYCAGVTCAMSPAALQATEALGYTNVKAYHEGVPVWAKTNALSMTPKLLKEAWLDKGQPVILLDARKAVKGGVLPGAAAMTDGSEKSTNRLYQYRKAKPPIVVYDEDGKGNAQAIAKAIAAAGQPAMVLAGGVAGWKGAGYALVDGAPAKEIAFVPKPKPGVIPVAEFKVIAATQPADTVVLDVRASDEVAAGAIKGSVNIPADQLAARTAELPRDKRIVCHCSTGTRAEMAYNVLKAAGFTKVAWLDAPVEFEGGKAEIGD
jgi:rhodanese-related sulfurtransferase